MFAQESVMDVQIDLRRGDFEGMHPKAKLFGFDEDKKLYTGDGVELITSDFDEAKRFYEVA